MTRKITYGSIIIAFVSITVFLLSCSPPKTPPTQPEENRFEKTVLLEGMDEPLELAVLPDGNILFIERKGALKLYRQDKKKVIQLAVINVFHELEDGLLGVTLDPDFKQNNYIYLFYSPAGDKPMQRISRFTLSDSKFDPSTEKILLEIPTQRKECCHSSGSLAFGPDKTLYIAVGDNTNPHNPGYYNSIDERAGREYWDAQRTAANTDDYRGKILRIKPEANGTYSTPAGNLFPKDGSKGKPEIFAMGCRNPYRITVDQKTGYLYWGDVGQNTEDNPARGPISYDEFHQAKGPGFFGWPYFAGDNRPYADFDFETEKIGPFFDAQHPINDSRNNTGSHELPPAQPAFIWYSYDSSARFENLGTGGKSPIIGPVYHADLYSKTPDWVDKSRKFPEYYNDKLFIAEWMRDWINVVTMDKEGNLTRIEKFMPSTKFAHPIDLEFGPDGALYVLEYGTFWFSQNQDAKLVRIDFNEGNRAPVAKIAANKTTGAAPLTVNFTASPSYDYDQGDVLTYEWTLDKKTNAQASGVDASYTFTTPGVYSVALKVVDPQGQQSTTEVNVQVGNEVAEISVETKGNKTFYEPGKPVHYQVTVSDKEDGTLTNGILLDQVSVTLGYVKDQAELKKILGNKNVTQTEFFGGFELMNQSDCKACHHQEKTSVGPSYEKIAARYKHDAKALTTLPEKIIKGGSGNWGETAMSAHPQLKKEEATEIVKYILSLAKDPDPKNRLPVSGSFVPAKDSTGNYLIKVVYLDRGGDVIGPQTASKIVVLRNPKVQALDADGSKGVLKQNDEFVRFSKPGTYISFSNIDLSGSKTITFGLSTQVSGSFELHLDSASGPPVGKGSFVPSTQKNNAPETVKMDLQSTSGTHDLYFVYTGEVKTEAGTNLRYITFN